MMRAMAVMAVVGAEGRSLLWAAGRAKPQVGYRTSVPKSNNRHSPPADRGREKIVRAVDNNTGGE